MVHFVAFCISNCAKVSYLQRNGETTVIFIFVYE